MRNTPVRNTPVRNDKLRIASYAYSQEVVMITTLELLDTLKAEKNLPSDYAVAKYLNVTHQAVSRWRKGRTMSEEICLKVAKELELDEDLVLLSNLCEKQTNEKAREALERLIAS